VYHTLTYLICIVSLNGLRCNDGLFMLEYLILENPSRDSWDSFIATNSLGNLWQTIDYGESFKKLYPRIRTPRLFAVRNGVTAGIAQGMFSKFFGFGTVMNVREGPLLSTMSSEQTWFIEIPHSCSREIWDREPRHAD